MNGTNRGAIRAYAAFSNDLIDLIVKDYPLDLFEDPFPILEAQPDPVWAGHPVWSRNAVKLMSALLPVVEGSFDCNPYVHGSPPYKELTLAQARSPTTTPMFCPLPAGQSGAGTFQPCRAGNAPAYGSGFDCQPGKARRHPRALCLSVCRLPRNALSSDISFALSVANGRRTINRRLLAPSGSRRETRGTRMTNRTDEDRRPRCRHHPSCQATRIAGAGR